MRAANTCYGVGGWMVVRYQRTAMNEMDYEEVSPLRRCLQAYRCRRNSGRA